MEKTLVIYYSLNGSTKFAAEKFAEKFNGNLLEIKPEKDIGPKGVMRYIRGGKQVFMKEKPQLLPFDKNINDYDFIIIGTPVWSWTFTPAIRTLLSMIDIQAKKIGLFCCHEGGAGKTLANMAQELAGNQIVFQLDFKKVFNNREEVAQRIAELQLED